jgi:hypothetical protein
VTGIDKTKPVVSSVTPSGTDEEISGTVAIAFNEIMSTEGGTVLLKDVALEGGTWENDVYTVPYSGLDHHTPYVITISGFKDAADNEMDIDTTHGFTTKPAPDPGDENDPAPAPSPGDTPAPIPDIDDDSPNLSPNPSPSPSPDPEPAPNPNPDPNPTPGPDEKPSDPLPVPDPEAEIPDDPRSSTTMIAPGITIGGVRYVIERQADGTWLIFVPHGTDISKIAITFLLPPGATCVPASGSVQDFSGKTVIYRVTSADKTKTEEYMIRVTEEPLTIASDSMVSDTTGAEWSVNATRRTGGSYKVAVSGKVASTFTHIPDDIYVLMEGLLTDVAITLLGEDGAPLRKYPDNDPIPRALAAKNARLRITGTAASREELESLDISRIDYIYASEPGTIFEQKISPPLTYDKIKTKRISDNADDNGDINDDLDGETNGGGCNVRSSAIVGLVGILLLVSLCRKYS